MNVRDVDTIRSVYDAFARRDLDIIHSSLAPDVVIEQPEVLPWGGRYKGHDGFDAFIGALLRRVEPNVEVGELVDAGDHIVQIGRGRGRILANGGSYDVREIHVWGFHDGRITSFTVYLDTATLAAALAAR
jgi:ketosteroid isomerase-like protein